MGVCFIWFAYQLSGARAPLFGSVVVRGHDCEEGEDYIMRFSGRYLIISFGRVSGPGALPTDAR